MKRDEEELRRLRMETKKITVDIIRLIGKRMKLVRRIGRLKKKLEMPVEDVKVEDEIRRIVLEESEKIGLNREFTLKLLNDMLNESVKIQRTFINEISDCQRSGSDDG